MLVSPFFPVRALSPLPLHPHVPRRNPLTDQCLSHGRKNLVTHRRKHTPSSLSTPRCNTTCRNPIADDAQDHPSSNRSSHAPQMARPYPPRPKRNPRLAAMEGIATQSPRRHPAHRTTIGPHPIARQDHPTMSFFPFYA
jgi:hypothetical protein